MKLRQIQQILSQQGYVCIRSTKHMTYSNGVLQVTVPHGKQIKRFVAKQILKQINYVGINL